MIVVYGSNHESYLRLCRVQPGRAGRVQGGCSGTGARTRTSRSGLDLRRGAGRGLMGEADAVLEAHGNVTGVIPEALVAKEVAHGGLSELRVVASMHERKAIMAELADASSPCPAASGPWKSSSRSSPGRSWPHRKPCGLLNVKAISIGCSRLWAIPSTRAFSGREVRRHDCGVRVRRTRSSTSSRPTSRRPWEKWIDRAAT